jgi:hypothetical protein
MDFFDYVGVESFQHINNFLNTHVAKAPQQEKGIHHIVESLVEILGFATKI